MRTTMKISERRWIPKRWPMLFALTMMAWVQQGCGKAAAAEPGAVSNHLRVQQQQQQQQPSTSTLDGSAHEGRLLQDGTCMCDDAPQEEEDDDDDEDLTVRFLVVGGQDHYLNFVGDRFSLRAPAFTNRTGIKVETVRVGELDDVNEEIFADITARVYDGYIFLPFITGSVVEQNGLADLTDFVRTNEDVNWPDIFRFNREAQSVYNNKVRLLPCDGDVHTLFYRKDLFEEHDIQVPRTWDEYTSVAEFFHGMEVPVPGSNETVKLTGSCVERKLSCHEGGYFNILVHSTTTQAGGTNTGALLNPENFEPLLGEGMAETLRHLENQAKYGNSEDELTGKGCNGINNGRFSEGRCAMTYFWGDVFARHLSPGSILEGRLGIAPTPGVTKVLDRETGQLVQCTEEICPYSETYDDIGRVNYAPYAAAGGWSAGVSGGVSKKRQEAMAAFFGYVCGEEQSLDDVIPFARGELFTGTDPYRKSQFDVEKWVERGYPEDTTILYQETIEYQLGSPNTVLDVRFPEAEALLKTMNEHIFAHLESSLVKEKSFDDRLEVANSIAEEWRKIIKEYNSRPTTSLPLHDIYQQSLNVWVPPAPSSKGGLSGGAIAGIVVGSSLFAALVTGVLFYFLIKREKEKSRMQWQIKKEDIRIQPDILGEGAFGVILKGTIRGTPVAVKPSHHSLHRHDSSTETGSQHWSKLTQKQLENDLAKLVKLRHPHIVQVIGAFIDRKSVLVVLEFMENGSLSTMLADAAGVAGREGRPFELQWSNQIAKGMEFLHGLPPPLGPLLHMDLRAANVLIDGSYNAKLTNFSLEAQVTGSLRDQGSMLWTAPEILNGEKPQPASDVYSFGMILFEIFARSRPFRVRRFSKSNLTDYTASTLSDPDDEIVPSTYFSPQQAEYYGVVNGEKLTVPEIIAQVSDLTAEPPVRPEIPADMPVVIRDITMECWAKNPNRRPTMTEILSRGSDLVGESSLTKTLARRSSIFDSILPQEVQEALARKEKVPPQSYPEVSVIFSDIVGFTATSSLLSAEEVGDMISRLFSKYDKLADRYGIKKLDVIGDAFLGVSGIPQLRDHATRAAGFALEAIEEAKKTPICMAKPHLGCINIRFGLATGPVVASVIGSALHPKYTLFGTTVNTASRMESSSEPNRVQCTKETADMIQHDTEEIGVQFRQRMDIKGRGFMDTYYLTAPDSGFKTIRPKTGSTTSARGRKTRRSIGDFSPSANLDSHSFREASIPEVSEASERERDESVTTVSGATGVTPHTLSGMDSDLESTTTKDRVERLDSSLLDSEIKPITTKDRVERLDSSLLDSEIKPITTKDRVERLDSSLLDSEIKPITMAEVGRMFSDVSSNTNEPGVVAEKPADDKKEDTTDKQRG